MNYSIPGSVIDTHKQFFLILSTELFSPVHSRPEAVAFSAHPGFFMGFHFEDKHQKSSPIVPVMVFL